MYGYKVSYKENIIFSMQILARLSIVCFLVLKNIMNRSSHLWETEEHDELVHQHKPSLKGDMYVLLSYYVIFITYAGIKWYFDS